jgi:hypothetical protein
MNDEVMTKMASNLASELAATHIRLAEAQIEVQKLREENGKLKTELAIRDKMKGGEANGSKTSQNSDGQKPTA